MSVSYDLFAGAFLAKITEYEFIQLPAADRTDIIDGFMKRAISAFKNCCEYDFTSSADDEKREFNIDIDKADFDELVDIISEGMVVQWLKPYLNQQELLENILTTRDYGTYSPAELLKRVGSAYKNAQGDFVQMIREYSYNHGDLTNLHI